MGNTVFSAKVEIMIVREIAFEILICCIELPVLLPLFNVSSLGIRANFYLLVIVVS